MITGKDLIEKLYSENEEIQEEKLYSTGDSDLDDLLERAFCEGYEYAQKEFGNKENKAAKRAFEQETGKKFIKGGYLKNDTASAVKLGREYLQNSIKNSGDRDSRLTKNQNRTIAAQPLKNIGQHRTSRGKLAQIFGKKQMIKDLDRNITERGGGVIPGITKKFPKSDIYNHGFK